MSRFGKGGFSGAGGHGCRILSKTLGAMLTRIPLASLRRPPSAITGEELEIDTLLQSCMPDDSAYYSPRPEYNSESLKWLLDFMTQMKAYENLRRVALARRNKTTHRMVYLLFERYRDCRSSADRGGRTPYESRF